VQNITERQGLVTLHEGCCCVLLSQEVVGTANISRFKKGLDRFTDMSETDAKWNRQEQIL